MKALILIIIIGAVIYAAASSAATYNTQMNKLTHSQAVAMSQYQGS